VPGIAAAALFNYTGVGIGGDPTELVSVSSSNLIRDNIAGDDPPNQRVEVEGFQVAGT
jgi:hypothetical protein